MADTSGQGATELATVREQAARYLRARFGPDYVYRAPEAFENTLERWIWAVAGDAPDLAEECMAAIEQHFARARRTDGDDPE